MTIIQKKHLKFYDIDKFKIKRITFTSRGFTCLK